MPVTRREMLKTAVAVPISFAGGRFLMANPAILEPEEEWTIAIGPSPDLALIVRVLPSGDITVCKGDEVLRPFRDTPKGWWTFRGKHGTRIQLRQIRPMQLDIDHFAVVEPTPSSSSAAHDPIRFFCNGSEVKPNG